MNKTIAQDWFEIIPFDHDIRLIREKYVEPWVRCNIWYIQGKNKSLLIDSGMGLRSLKSEISFLTEKPIDCISTHCHFDHFGGAYEFDSHLGHQLEVDVYQHPTEKNTASFKDFVRDEAFLALPFDSFTPDKYFVRPAPLTGYLDEGDVLDLGDRHFSVFHLPGHSPGSIALYEAKTQTLFSGDVIYDGELFDTVYHSDKTTYKESLQRLQNLPIQTVHGGHYGSFGKTQLDNIIESYFRGEGMIGDANSWVEKQI